MNDEERITRARDEIDIILSEKMCKLAVNDSGEIVVLMDRKSKGVKIILEIKLENVPF